MYFKKAYLFFFINQTIIKKILIQASEAPLYNFKTDHGTVTKITQNNVLFISSMHNLIDSVMEYDVIMTSYLFVYGQKPKLHQFLLSKRKILK